MGVHEWNPLRAMKDVEVGDYYYKTGELQGSAQPLSGGAAVQAARRGCYLQAGADPGKDKEFEEARARYEEYLAILKDGPSAGEARKALERLNKRETDRGTKKRADRAKAMLEIEPWSIGTAGDREMDAWLDRLRKEIEETTRDLRDSDWNRAPGRTMEQRPDHGASGPQLRHHGKDAGVEHGRGRSAAGARRKTLRVSEKV